MVMRNISGGEALFGRENKNFQKSSYGGGNLEIGGPVINYCLPSGSQSDAEWRAASSVAVASMAGTLCETLHFFDPILRFAIFSRTPLAFGNTEFSQTLH